METCEICGKGITVLKIAYSNSSGFDTIATVCENPYCTAYLLEHYTVQSINPIQKEESE